MSRIRSIHPGFFTDESFVQVSAFARLLLLGLGVEADDQGTFAWKPVTLKMRLFPMDAVDIQELLKELEQADAIRRYRDPEGREFGAIRNFRMHQRPKSPNSINFIPDDFRNYVGLTPPDSGNDDSLSQGNSAKRGKASADGGEGRGEEGRIELSLNSDCASDDALKPEHFVESWNNLAIRIGRPRIRDLTPERRVQLKARINGFTIEDFKEVIKNIEQSPFLRGEKKWAGVTFDWVTKKANFQKILEGNYSDKSP